jgi:hypothetical protein
MYQGPTSSESQTVWNPPDGPHIPMYPESGVGGTDDPSPIATKSYYITNPKY